MTTRGSSLSERVYGLLLRAYPARVRARFAAGMTYAFGHELDEARASGGRALLAFWLTTILTTVWFGFSARCDRVPHVDPAEAYGDLTMRQRFTIDWRDAWRSLRATPLVTAIAVLSLALGIGANTALFSILNSLILKSLPVRDAERARHGRSQRVDQPDLGADSRTRARARRRRLRVVERFVRLVPGRTDGSRRGTVGQRTDVRSARRADDPRPNAHRGRRRAGRRTGRRGRGDQLWVLAAAIRRRG